MEAVTPAPLIVPFFKSAILFFSLSLTIDDEDETRIKMTGDSFVKSHDPFFGIPFLLKRKKTFVDNLHTHKININTPACSEKLK